MLIQIQEKAQQADGFLIELIFNRDKSQSFEINFKSPHTPKAAKDLDWYFEEFIYEPYTAATKTDKIVTLIEDYGKQIFEQLFQNEAALALYRKGIQTEGFRAITFEIINNNQSINFQSILWETLRDVQLAEGPLVANGVIFRRKSNKKPLLKSKVGTHSQLNLLIVTARPSEDNDVNHRTIQRPLVEIISNDDVRVNPFILRPGTYKALKSHLQEVPDNFYHIIHFDVHGKVMEYEDLLEEREEGNINFTYTFGKPTFQARFARKDIKKFDGKKAFLFFETETKGVAEPTTANEIAVLIRNSKIPVCILNACQSAKQVNDVEETSLAKTIHEQGVALVLAMRYSISVTAARLMMETMYRAIFSNKKIERAISLGQTFLHDEKNRVANLRMKVDLEDWMLPVIYQGEKVDFQLKKPDEQEGTLLEHYQEKLPLPKFGFVGRDLDILRVEKLLLKTNHLLLRGMIGVGKSALLKYLTNWWKTTNFRNVQKVIYLDWNEKKYTHAKFIDAIAGQLFQKKDLKAIKSKSIEARRIKVIKQLNQTPYALLLDNLFQFSDKKIILFLTQLTGQSFVVYGSVNGEDILGPNTFKENTYQLDGLDQDAAYELADAIISNTTSKDFQQLIKGDNKFDFEHLLKLLAGFPSAMELVLPSLKDMSVEAVLEGFREGSLDVEFS